MIVKSGSLYETISTRKYCEEIVIFALTCGPGKCEGIIRETYDNKLFGNYMGFVYLHNFSGVAVVNVGHEFAVVIYPSSIECVLKV